MASSTRANLGHLTTIWKPPAPCSTPVLHSTDYGWDVAIGVHYGIGCTQVDSGIVGSTIETSCYPQELATYLDAQNAYDTLPVYSPASDCPNGWSAACTVTRDAVGGESPSTSLVPAEKTLRAVLDHGETAIGCCPR